MSGTNKDYLGLIAYFFCCSTAPGRERFQTSKTHPIERNWLVNQIKQLAYLDALRIGLIIIEACELELALRRKSRSSIKC